MSQLKDVVVLYVDDEEINLFLFNAIFSHKYSIITSTSGAEGLQKLDAHANEIIVVISDMKMPEMDGIAFIEQAKEKHLNVAYFILTAYEFDERIDLALKTNLIQYFFTKPFDQHKIEAAIDSVAHQFGVY